LTTTGSEIVAALATPADAVRKAAPSAAAARGRRREEVRDLFWLLGGERGVVVPATDARP
jgi:hypothetical protein